MKNNLCLNKTAVTQPTVKPHRCIKLGLDVHAESIRVVRMLDAATPQPAQKMTQPDFLKWVKKQLALADEVYSCYEAGPMGFGLHRKLIAMGVRNVVVRPQCLDDFLARMKTDKIDALGLAKRLDFYVQGNRTALAVIRVPSEKEEQERALSRQREQLVRTTKQLAAQGRSLMLYQGFRVIGVWWRRQWSELSRRLPEWLIQRLEVFRAVLLVLDKQVNALTTQLETAAPSGLPYGLGPLSFEVIRREIGDWKRFKQSAASRKLYRPVFGRFEQRQQATHAVHQQMWQSTIALGAGRGGLAFSTVSTAVASAAKMEACSIDTAQRQFVQETCDSGRGTPTHG